MAARGIGSVYCGLAACLLLSLATIRYDKAIIALSLGFCVVYWRATAATLQRHRDLVVATAALLAWIAVLTWLRDDRTSRLLFIQYASFATGFLAALVALDHVTDPARAARVVLLFALLPVVFLLLPDWVVYGRYMRVFQPFGEHQGRWSSIFNNPNNYGIAMATSFAIAVSLWLERMIGLRLLLIAAVIFGFQIHLSGSRNAVAAVATVTLLGAIALRRHGRMSAWAAGAAVLIGAAVAAAAAALVAGLLAPDTSWGRSIAIPLGIRQIAWTSFPRLALEHPWLGTSAARFLTGDLVAHGHNLLLTLAVEWGLIGLALSLVWAIAFARAVSWSWAHLIAITPFLTSQVIDDFHYFRPFSLLAAMVAAWCVAAPPGRTTLRPNVRSATQERPEPPGHGAGDGQAVAAPGR